ncbi:MAG: FAD-dependent oxidoreductase [Novosphingobium sp.]
MHVLIIGGGIGGTALAMCLEKSGIDYTLFEQAPVLRDTGTGIGMWANGIGVLDYYGLGDEVREMADSIEFAQILNDRGDVLNRVDLKKNMRLPVSDHHLVRRLALHDLLVRQIDTAKVRMNSKLEDWTTTPEGKVVAIFSDGHRATGDLLVGCDGIRSAVRNKLWGPRKLRFCGPGWRGIAPIKAPAKSLNIEIQGRDGRRFGYCPIDEKTTYWWATHTGSSGQAIAPEDRQTIVRNEFADWDPYIVELIEATDQQDIYYNDMLDMEPLDTWSRGPITLLGDAAHPTTPNMAQGGNMAVEEAGLLTQLLLRYDDLGEVLRIYDALRVPRAKMIVTYSRLWGAMGAWRSRLACIARELIIKITPNRVYANTQRKMSVWSIDSELRRAEKLRAA